MKKYLLAVMLVLMVCGIAFGANPTVTLSSVVYADDNSSVVNLLAIAPYRDVKFTYSITSLVSSVTYSGSVQTGNEIRTLSGVITGSPLRIIIEKEFSPYESGKISLNVNDANGSGSVETSVTAIDGVRPTVHVTGIDLKGWDIFSTPANEISGTIRRDNGEIVRPTAVVYPDNADDKEVVWSSSNETVATVEQDGAITPHYAGEATITAKTTDGGFTATCRVTVVSDGVSSISLNPFALTLDVGETVEIRIPEALVYWQEQELQRIIGDNSIAEIQYSSGLLCMVKAISPGTTELIVSTVSVTGEPIQASCQITVRDEDDNSDDNTDISAAKEAIEGATYTASQTDVTNVPEAKDAIIDIISGLNNTHGVTMSINDIGFTDAIAGTAGNPNGTNGSYTFTITLNKGTGTEQTTAQRTLTILATPYNDGTIPDPEPTSGSGGCNSGFAVFALAALLTVGRRKKYQ